MNYEKKILLVDDDIDVLEQNKILFEAEGFQVETAENSVDGYEKFLEFKPACAIVDLMMEEYDSGFVLAHKIKRHPMGKKIPVFIVTAVASQVGMQFDSMTPEEREWIHAEDVLNKPVVISDILVKLSDFYKEQQ
ncbi:MAG: response regulator [Ignavibacteriaceae bacterium]|nr:MAG: response regulator [Ignavibacteriaceae bacterium]MBW7874028.1 response regulator [Ignavibacteria bacterium]MBZ0198151.1 response regulator [Ignavibacteriaceae bacterium]OQY73578.1 MAG: response regulator [Ignavibacteriales bacterium UTCHB3]WKZ72543.1 MAG: response regulator [Ignavibacteriaceae bacterium]